MLRADEIEEKRNMVADNIANAIRGRDHDGVIFLLGAYIALAEVSEMSPSDMANELGAKIKMTAIADMMAKFARYN